ncbi:ketoacyl-ACP synthase III family protein [Actinomadura macrotermitis]|uniref:3-oxoacyl-[acyl-carrier-protein] synthase 3 n=1 Tax=Actinomadura macrotermitis TaxID=2585200 RepID=A0A7K0BVF6_9ACTN|nr:ketoacyl-ACP synthase III family protein [Actinomadura macrotermitis]MQY05056.1 3-oxoacyl-[acyl-carrier-protein] synthase 3 [Actinomadura macrotermitis]
MRFDDIYVLGLGTELGQTETVQAALDRGAYQRKWADLTGQLATSVSDAAAPELAVGAGRKALAAAGLGTSGLVRDAVGLHLHVCTNFQGLDMWPAQCFVLDQLGGGGSVLTGQLGALSNGFMAAIEIAAGMLNGRPDLTAALLTSGDRFCEPGFLRWSTQSNVVFGDGGAAMVLGRRPGPAQLVSVVSQTDPGLEGLLRGDKPFDQVSRLAFGAPDITDRMRWFVERNGGLDAINERKNEGLRAAVRQALAEAGLELADVRWAAAPFFGQNYVHSQVIEPLGLRAEQVDIEFGLRTGHLGASDPVVGLDHLISSGQARPGDAVLLLGIATGYMWSAAVVRVLG